MCWRLTDYSAAGLVFHFAIPLPRFFVNADSKWFSVHVNPLESTLAYMLIPKGLVVGRILAEDRCLSFTDPGAEIAVLVSCAGAGKTTGLALRYVCWAGPARRVARKPKKAQPRMAVLLCPKMKKAAAGLPHSRLVELPKDIIPSPRLLTKRGASQKSCGGVR
jgi:hypothetical protein